MELSIAAVRRIARLARVALDEREAVAMQRQLMGIFRLIEQLQAVDTAGIEPMSHAQDVMLRMREDVVSEGDRRESFQAIAPQFENGLYLVPKVIE